MYRCRVCKIDKMLSEFYANRRTKTGYTYACKLCLSAEAKRDRTRDRTKARENDKRKNRQRRNRNPRQYWADTNFRNVRKRALRRGLDFDLDVEFLLEIAPTHCPIFGIELDFLASEGKISDRSPSIDRVDNSLGYVKSNIAVMSNRANRLKSDASVEELRKLADFIERVTTSRIDFRSEPTD